MSLWAERNIPSKSKDYGKNTCKCRGKNVNLRLKMNISSLSKYDMIADKIEYIIMLIKLFARHFGLSYMQAFRYVSLHDGIEYAERHYNILHTLSFEEQVEGLAAFCRTKGGLLT